MWRKAARLAVPALLGLLGAGALSGCLFIPTFNATIEGRNVSFDVGAVDSGKAIRVDRATASDVYRVLGPPEYTTPDGRQVAYTWRVLNGFWIGLCFGAQTGERGLVLEFDASSVLRSFQVTALDHGPPLLAPGMMRPPLPAGMRLMPKRPPLFSPARSADHPSRREVPTTLASPGVPLSPNAVPNPTPPR